MSSVNSNFKVKNLLEVQGTGTSTIAGALSITGALAGVTTLAASGQITSTLSIGTAPFVITSTTQVANLNVQSAGNIVGGAIGQIVYQTGSGTTGFVAVGSAGQVLRSAGSAIPVYSTSTFADTYGANTLLYANGANTIQGLTTGNNGILVTSGSGVPSISSALPPLLTTAITTAISAAGSTQGTATALTTDINNVTTVASSTGVVLPTAVAGQQITVINNGANILNIYPATGAAIDGLTTNTATYISKSVSITFRATSATQWYTVNAAINSFAWPNRNNIRTDGVGYLAPAVTWTDSIGQYAIPYASLTNVITPLNSVINSVFTTAGSGAPQWTTALPALITVPVSATVSAAGSNQGGATALTTDYNIVTTVAANTGVALPTAVAGTKVTVVNKGANPLAVYPASGGAIDALSTNAALTLPVGGWIEFDASSTTQWYSTANAYLTTSGFAWTTISSANVATAVTSTGYLMDTGGTLRTVTLPSSVPAGFACTVMAVGGQVRIVSNSNVIDGVGSGNDLLLGSGMTASLVGKSTGNLEIVYGGGGVAIPVVTYTVVTKTLSYTESTTSGTQIILCNATTGNIIVSLPTAVGNTTTFIIKKIDSSTNTITIDGYGNETIDGSYTAPIYNQNNTVTIVSNNVNWFVV